MIRITDKDWFRMMSFLPYKTADIDKESVELRLNIPLWQELEEAEFIREKAKEQGLTIKVELYA